MREWFLASVCIAVLSANAVGAMPVNEKTIHDHWYALYMMGARCGYGHIQTLERTEDGRKYIVTSSVVHADIRRGAVTMATDEISEYVETPDGQAVRFSSEVTMTGMNKRVTGEIKDGKLYIKVESAERIAQNTYDWDPQCLFPYAAEVERKKYGLRPGTSYTLKTYSPELNISGPTLYTSTVTSKVTERIHDKDIALNRIDTRVHLPGFEMQIIELYDDNFVPYVIEMPAVGPTKMVLTTQEQALQTAEVAELMARSLLPSNRKIADPEKVASATFDLKLTAGTFGDLVEDERQSLKRLSPSEIQVATKRTPLPTTAAYQIPCADPKMAECLSDSWLLQTKSSIIQNLARKIAGDKKDPIQIANSVDDWVYENIKQKNLSIALGTAVDVATNLEGDCTEHSVLAAALLRALGIPSRIVVGLAYSPAQNVFGYHMWSECYVGQWIPVDAAYAGHGIDPLHIAFSKSALDGPNPELALGLSLIRYLAALQIQVVDIQE